MYKKKINAYLNLFKRTLDNVDYKELCKTLDVLQDACKKKKHIFIMGNGGSSATASHYAGDFNKGLSLDREHKYRFIALNDNAPTVLSLANDVSYDDIFVEQLKNFLDPGDIVIAISGSGNSANIIKAAKYAHEHGNIVIGMTGFSGGKLLSYSTIKLHVPVDNMQIVEDIHMMFAHLMYYVLY